MDVIIKVLKDLKRRNDHIERLYEDIEALENVVSELELEAVTWLEQDPTRFFNLFQWEAIGFESDEFGYTWVFQAQRDFEFTSFGFYLVAVDLEDNPFDVTAPFAYVYCLEDCIEIAIHEPA